MTNAGRWRRSLLPLASGFGALTGVRNSLYDRGLIREHGVGVPVISVGNLVAGGTGKTPFVEYLVRRLIGAVPKLAVISRGYGRRSRGLVIVSGGSGEIADASQGGDEPVQIARKFPGLAVVVAEDRVAAAHRAVDGLGAEAIILDDGYQHRSLRRDCNILLLDARREIFKEPMLPAGYRREPLRGMRRADLALFTRVDSQSGDVSWEPELRRWFRGPVASSRIATARVVRASDGRAVETLPGRGCFAFSGIADHRGFVSGLQAQGIVVAGERSFSDHHLYDEADLDRITGEFERSGADVLLTTEKDLMRLQADDRLARRACAELPLFYVVVELQVIAGEQELLAMIDRTVARSAA